MIDGAGTNPIIDPTQQQSSKRQKSLNRQSNQGSKHEEDWQSEESGSDSVSSDYEARTLSFKEPAESDDELHWPQSRALCYTKDNDTIKQKSFFSTLKYPLMWLDIIVLGYSRVDFALTVKYVIIIQTVLLVISLKKILIVMVKWKMKNVECMIWSILFKLSS